MSIKADMKYNGVVGPGSHLYETQTGTLGYQVTLECADGSTSFVIWLTQKNRERSRRYFEVLGVDPELLKNPGYIEYQLGMDIEGREVSFGTKDEEYNGRHDVKVVWIGKNRTQTCRGVPPVSSAVPLAMAQQLVKKPRSDSRRGPDERS